ncbi:hypothetical protein GCM10011578_043030 [Streptomyces fuscichromogenes]|uniref:Uncharacterized protein n=1 Tax=Streptomyces fuscichromogenes TaxID=1324013 RepID=A0A918CSE5_9ACTN|nr:hypothetical protein GCM10011578_043030 [Streptomyces fuscichromogenes]
MGAFWWAAATAAAGGVALADSPAKAAGNARAAMSAGVSRMRDRLPRMTSPFDLRKRKPVVRPWPAPLMGTSQQSNDASDSRITRDTTPNKKPNIVGVEVTGSHPQPPKGEWELRISFHAAREL